MITTIILAAGRSRRMGQPKMLLRWRESTVLQTVIAAFREAGIEDILVVTGAGAEQVEDLVAGSAQTVYNPEYIEGEMLSSIQAGLSARQGRAEAALIALGDQPQVKLETIQRILEAYHTSGAGIIMPSFENRRGHPWLVGARYWEEIRALRAPSSMRDFFRVHGDEIRYAAAPDASVLADLDTPEDYSAWHR